MFWWPYPFLVKYIVESTYYDKWVILNRSFFPINYLEYPSSLAVMKFSVWTDWVQTHYPLPLEESMLTITPTMRSSIMTKYPLESYHKWVPITTKVVSLNPSHGEVYSMQHNVIKFVSDLRQVGGFLRVLCFLKQWNRQSRYNWNIVLKQKWRLTP